MVTPTSVQAAPLVRPVWRRLRLWVGLAALLVLAALVVVPFTHAPGRPLDPASTEPNGSRALDRVLAGYGISLTETASIGTALRAGSDATVVVTVPDDYSDAQLRDLAAAPARLVLVSPGRRATAAVAPALEPDPNALVEPDPNCDDPGAIATGLIEPPDDGVAYRERSDTSAGRLVRCYGGGYVVGDRLTVLGSTSVLENSTLGRTGVAALAINAVTADRRVTRVVWLVPGADAAGPGAASVWDLFPAGAQRAFWWLIGLGVLVVLWRARRLGAVIGEALPVIVRSAEVVEGHGRLYLRAGARDRAAAALRAAASERVAARLGLPRTSPPPQIALTAAPLVGRAPAELAGLLTGPPPVDDARLVRLARDLDAFEAAVAALEPRTTDRSTYRGEATP